MNFIDWLKTLQTEKQTLIKHKDMLQEEIRKSQMISASTVALVDIIAITVKKVKEEQDESHPNN